MPFGYSHNFALQIEAKYKSDKNNPVFQMGHLAVEKEVMLSEIASELGVSKQAIYKWFEGAYAPKEDVMKKIIKLNKKLEKL
jgi:DNA-binding XRE family transcriptional regulator